MEITGDTLLSDLPPEMMDEICNSLDEAGKDDPFFAYRLCRELVPDERLKTFPYEIEGLTMEIADEMCNFYLTVLESETVPLPTEKMNEWLVPENPLARRIYVVVIAIIRLKFQNFLPFNE